MNLLTHPGESQPLRPVESAKALARRDQGDSNTNRPPYRPRRLFVLARHGESAANQAGVISSDPAHPVPLTARGESQARQLGSQLFNLNIDIAICTGLVRTQRTIELALGARLIPILIDRDFDEIRAGALDGATIQEYWSWKEHHAGRERFPHGESIDDAFIRYSKGFGVCCREASRLRWSCSTSSPCAGFRLLPPKPNHFPNSDGDIANGVPYLFDDSAIERAANRLETRARSDKGGLRRQGAPEPDGRGGT